MKSKSLGFIGGGRITKIFLQAFANKKTRFESVVVFDNNSDVLFSLKKQFPDIEIAETMEQAAKQHTVFIALHPPVIMECLNQIGHSIATNSVIVSLAPKITIEKIALKLRTANIARMIPNAASYINEGFNPITFASNFSEKEKSDLMDMLTILGQNPETIESKLEAYAMIGAMGHTYFWFQIQKMNELAIDFGMDAIEAKLVISEMWKGTVHTLYNSGLSYNEVIDLVPVKPLGPVETTISDFYGEYLTSLFNKIKP